MVIADEDIPVETERSGSLVFGLRGSRNCWWIGHEGKSSDP